MNGIATRVAVLSSLVVFFATATVGFLVYNEARDSLIRSASERVAHTTETVKVGTWGTVGAIEDDVLFLARTPPVEGIVRARMERGLDPMWSIRDDEWGVQLAETFRAFLEGRSSYLRARFVGVDGGRELVRVERRDGRVVFADPGSFRSLAATTYLEASANLPKDDLYLSSIKWGDEADEIPETVPIMIMSTPVYAENGQVFGIVAVTVDFRDILATVEPLVDANQTLYVADEQGALLHVFGSNNGTAHPGRLQDLFPAAVPLIRGETNSARMFDTPLGEGSRGIAYAEAVYMDRSAASPRMLFGVSEPHETILAGVRSVRNTSALITVLLALAAVALALTTSRYITQPIRQISNAVSRFGDGSDLTALPTRREDEIGLLARSFASMEQQIQEQIRSLEDLSQTLEKRVEERTSELARLNRELEASNRELQEIASVASHDLQEPLRKLRSFADLLASDYKNELDKEGVFYVQRIFCLAERMSHLLSDLLSFSSVASAPKKVRKVDLRELTLEVVGGMSKRIADTGGRVEVGPLPKIDADPRQLRVLLSNLIENALSYRKPDAPPVVTISGATGTDASGRHVCNIVVEDNGIGFDEKYADRIFAPFERLQEERTIEKTGMGLTICRRIAENHLGTITARSSPGEGSSFLVTLPLNGHA